MKTKTVTYEVVAKVIDEMHKAGEKITFRNVIARTGGAGSSIVKYIKLWHEQRKVLAEGHTVSDEVLLAIIKESERVATHATEVANNRIKDLEAFIDGVEEAIAENEAKLEEADKLKQEFLAYQERNKILEAENTTIKQQFERALQDAEAMKAEINNLVDQASTLSRDKQKIEQDVLIWRTKAEQLEQQLNTTFKDFVKK